MTIHIFFRNYLDNGRIEEDAPKTQADYNLIWAVRECKKFVEGWRDNGSLLELLKLVKNRLSFIFYITYDEGSVYNTFEVLNSRGLGVDWLDKCQVYADGVSI